MTENKKNLSTKPLTNDQLTGVTGGDLNGDVIVHPIRRKVCAADSSHLYLEIYTECPVCGSKEFTSIL